MSSDIQIYVACLAAYNNGYLHGKWIDATQELDDIWSEVKAMLKASPVSDAEEYAIHDYEGFQGYGVGEYEGIERVHEIATYLEERGEIAGAVLEHYCGDIDCATKAIEEDYSGCFESLGDYAEELTTDTSEVPKHLEFYIDFERMGRDMEMSGDIYTIETGYRELHVFWSR